MTSTHHETLYKSVRVDGDISERTGRVVVDGIFQVDAEPIKESCNWRSAPSEN